MSDARGSELSSPRGSQWKTTSASSVPPLLISTSVTKNAPWAPAATAAAGMKDSRAIRGRQRSRGVADRDRLQAEIDAGVPHVGGVPDQEHLRTVHAPAVPGARPAALGGPARRLAAGPSGCRPTDAAWPILHGLDPARVPHVVGAVEHHLRVGHAVAVPSGTGRRQDRIRVLGPGHPVRRGGVADRLRDGIGRTPVVPGVVESRPRRAPRGCAAFVLVPAARTPGREHRVRVRRPGHTVRRGGVAGLRDAPRRC